MSASDSGSGIPPQDFDQTLAAVRRSGGNRTEALWALLHACRGHLLALAERSTEPALRRHVGPSDLVSEAMLDAHGSIDQFRGQTEGQFRRWLGAILRTRVSRARRRHSVGRPISVDGPRPPGLDLALIAPDTPPSESARRSEDADRLRRALAELPEHYRRVIQLHFIEMKTAPEIAVILNVTEAAAHGYLLRAVRRLREALTRHVRPKPRAPLDSTGRADCDG